MDNQQGKIILTLSFMVVVLISISSFTALFSPDFYFKETQNWQAQSVGQDFINLCLIVPFLLTTSVMIFKKKLVAQPLWAGTTMYLIYTYLIYCFNIHFNSFFIFYCLILGLCFYQLIYFFYSRINKPSLEIRKPKLIKVIGIYFLVISVLFYFLWLSEIVSALINNTVPKSVMDAGLVTNPVQIIDLSVLLPGVFITAILLLKRKRLGFLLSPIILTFFILMDITIGSLTIIMAKKGIEANLSVAAIMCVFALFSLILLVLTLRNSKIVT